MRTRKRSRLRVPPEGDGKRWSDGALDSHSRLGRRDRLPCGIRSVWAQDLPVQNPCAERCCRQRRIKPGRRDSGHPRGYCATRRGGDGSPLANSIHFYRQENPILRRGRRRLRLHKIQIRDQGRQQACLGSGLRAEFGDDLDTKSPAWRFSIWTPTRRTKSAIGRTPAEPHDQDYSSDGPTDVPWPGLIDNKRAHHMGRIVYAPLDHEISVRVRFVNRDEVPGHASQWVTFNADERLFDVSYHSYGGRCRGVGKGCHGAGRRGCSSRVQG